MLGGVGGTLQVSTALPLEEEVDHGTNITPTSLDGRLIFESSSSPKSAMTAFESVEDKAQAIHQCLKPHGGLKYVDVWALRELALSRGGLLSPSFRRLAWPKLVGISENSASVLGREEEAPPKRLEMPTNLLQLVKQDIVNSTVWPVASLMQHSMEGNKEFWYAPLRMSRSFGVDAPGLALSTPCSSSANSENTVEDHADDTESTIVSTGSTTLTSKEQEWLEQVLTNVLTSLTTDRHRSGLANVTALLMVNLESMPLTSAFLVQLASYPLWSAFFADESNIKSVEEMLCVLMREFQPNTVLDSSTISSFSNQVLTWFTSENSGTYNLQVASRLIDACIVSHPLFPLYFGTAASAFELWTMENVENSIVNALRYMEEMPPKKLLETVKADLPLPSTPSWAIAATAIADGAQHNAESSVRITMPPFSPAARRQADKFSDDDTNSDWERLSTASETGSICDTGGIDDDEEPAVASQEMRFFELYPNAMTAAGLMASSTKKSMATKEQRGTQARRGKVGVASIIIAIILSAAFAWSQGHYDKQSETTTTKTMLTDVPTKVPEPAPSSFEPLMATSPNSGHSKMVRSDDEMAQPVSTMPEAEKLLHKYMLDGVVQSMSLTTYVDSYLDTLCETPEPVPSSHPVMPSEPLVPLSLKSGHSRMVSADAAMAQPLSATPESEKLLHKFLMDGVVQSMSLEDVGSSMDASLRKWKSSVCNATTVKQAQEIRASTEQTLELLRPMVTQEQGALVKERPQKLKLLRPIVRQVQKVGRFLKKVVSFVVRRRPRGSKKQD